MNNENKQTKKNYNDLLFWLSSPMNSQDYRLTPSQVTLLRKLIHYSRKESKITFSNKIIGQHIFLSERTVENAFQHLIRLGIVSSSYIKIIDDGKYHTRRTAYIKWDLLTELEKTIPTFNEDDEPISNIIEDKQPEPKEETIQPKVEIQPEATEDVLNIQSNNEMTQLIKIAKKSGLSIVGVNFLIDSINDNVEGYMTEDDLFKSIQSLSSMYAMASEKNKEYQVKKELEVTEDEIEELYEDDGNELIM